MEFETIDDSQSSLPAEVVTEIKGMTKWMNFTAVILIIIQILSLLGDLSAVSKTPIPQLLISMLSSIVGIYLSFMVIKSSGFFNSFADTRDEDALIQSLKLTKNYWMISTIMVIISILLGISNN